MNRKVNYILLSAVISFYTILFLSCKNDKNNLIPDETTFSSILADSTYTIRLTQLNSPRVYEFGLRFSPNVSGSITKLGCKLPKKGSYRMCLWNVNEQKQLAETTVNQTNSDLAWQAISKASVEAGKSYYVTVISDNWFDAYPKTGGNVKYPLLKGNIQIQAFGYVQNFIGSPSKMPTLEDNTTSISGIVDFGFQIN
ncbi:hypothetical protein VB796_09070 [Arcicella sp. LKC2W]|uniref:hypothetical protein n=1 Tax=Arcicella sp. LKC2W TaxID=2984198 RepID=UPI002B200D3B|nr:hypothetical protein [Arcicella sp. LKC2W]MEA5459187.1 hypothetical protein [Arcicella sp. LKC2W]